MVSVKSLVLFVVLLLCPTVLSAQSLSPLVTLDMETDSVTVGEPVVLRLTVPVPSYLPEPPVFPAPGMPDLMLRLPGAHPLE